MGETKVLNVEIVDSEVNLLMRANSLGCLVKRFPSCDGIVYGCEVEVYLMDERCKRLGDGGVSDVGFAEIEDFNSGRAHTIAAEMSLTKAKRRAVLAYLGKQYEYSEPVEKDKKKK